MSPRCCLFTNTCSSSITFRSVSDHNAVRYWSSMHAHARASHPPTRSACSVAMTLLSFSLSSPFPLLTFIILLLFYFFIILYSSLCSSKKCFLLAYSLSLSPFCPQNCPGLCEPVPTLGTDSCFGLRAVELMGSYVVCRPWLSVYHGYKKSAFESVMLRSSHSVSLNWFGRCPLISLVNKIFLCKTGTQ